MKIVDTDVVVKTSKSQHTIPFYKGVHLHSAYDPEKEAKNFAKQYEEKLKANPSVIILGLGFGYHVVEVIELLKRYHTSYQVKVIEPSQNLFNAYRENFQNASVADTDICISEDPSQLYANESLIEALANKPVVITHAASFNLHHDYFKSFLSYKAPTSVNQFNIKNEAVRQRITELAEEGTLENCFQNIKKQGYIADHIEFQLLALQAMIGEKSNKEVGNV